jgi:hypothetical protein
MEDSNSSSRALVFHRRCPLALSTTPNFLLFKVVTKVPLDMSWKEE